MAKAWPKTEPKCPKTDLSSSENPEVRVVIKAPKRPFVADTSGTIKMCSGTRSATVSRLSDDGSIIRPLSSTCFNSVSSQETNGAVLSTTAISEKPIIRSEPDGPKIANADCVKSIISLLRLHAIVVNSGIVLA